MKAVRKLRTGPGGVDLVEVEPQAGRAGNRLDRRCGNRRLRHRPAHRGGRVPDDAAGDHGPRDLRNGRGNGCRRQQFLGRHARGLRDVLRYLRTCRWCLSGRRNLCPRRRSLGSHVDGGFAAEVIVPSRNLHRVPDGVGVQAAALSEPLACVCHALLDPPLIGAGDRVLVTGPGPIGLLGGPGGHGMGGRVEVAGLPADRDRLDLAASSARRSLTSRSPTSSTSWSNAQAAQEVRAPVWMRAPSRSVRADRSLRP